MLSGKINQLMKKIIFFIFTVLTLTTYGQGAQERVLYVVDSIAIIEDPDEEDGTLAETDIETLTVVTNKGEIEKHGYKDLDKIIFIITKDFAKRPDDIKKIPTTKQMERKNGKWFSKDSTVPYTGPFIDYYFNGKKQGEGILKEGVLEGIRTVYYQNGNKKYFRTYVNGVTHGQTVDYFPEGQIHQKGNFKNGKNDGIWQDWYSGGQLKRQTQFKDGEPIMTEEEKKLQALFKKAMKMFDEYNYSGAAKTLDKAVELNPNFSDAYFHRGTAYFNDFKFDEAIKDYDKAIELEPLYMEALSNRAFSRLRKYEFKNSRTLSKKSGVTVMASKDKVEIPKEELEKICSDLAKGIQLGDNKAMILDAQKTYCR
jgi:antitoxin component YwqK of YwqJK toxin-antitoxin module